MGGPTIPMATPKPNMLPITRILSIFLILKDILSLVHFIPTYLGEAIPCNDSEHFTSQGDLRYPGWTLSSPCCWDLWTILWTSNRLAHPQVLRDLFCSKWGYIYTFAFVYRYVWIYIHDAHMNVYRHIYIYKYTHNVYIYTHIICRCRCRRIAKICFRQK